MIGSMNGWRALRAVSLGAVILGFGPTLTMAQQAQEVPKTPPKTSAGNYSSWVKICTKTQETDNKQVCLVKYEGLNPKTGDVLVAAAVRTIEGEDKRDLIINVPTAYSLVMPAGVRIKIDEDEPISLKYAVCFSTNCSAQTELTKQVFDGMRKGKQLLIAAINMQDKPLTFPVPLEGFAKTSDGAPVDNAKYQRARSEMLALAKKSAAGEPPNNQGATPAQLANPNAAIAPQKMAPPSPPQ